VDRVSVGVSTSEEGARPVPDEIESPRAKLVYLYLATTGRASVDDLANDLGMQKLALFSVLGTLAGRGVVASSGDSYHLA
jgi:predicted ArsR family transcriptional regulator